MAKTNTESRGGQGVKRDRRNDPKPGDPGFPHKKDIYALAPLLKQGEHFFLRQVLDKIPSKPPERKLETWYSEERFAKDMNCHVRTIKNYVKVCKNLGIIKVCPECRQGKFASNVYSFNYPWPPELVDKLEKLQESKPVEVSQQSDQGKISTVPGENIAPDRGKISTAPGENIAPDSIHTTLTTSYSFQNDCTLREEHNSRSELCCPVGHVSGEEDVVEQEAFHPQDSEKGGVPLAGSTRLEREEDADPSTYDVLRDYEGRSDLDRPLTDTSREADVKSTAENFLTANWEHSVSTPKTPALMLTMRAVRDGKISDDYRPENFGELGPKRREEKIQFSREVREHIDECINECYPDGRLRQVKRWNAKMVDNAWRWRKGIPISREGYERDWETDWQLLIEKLVLYLAVPSRD